jgi:hypothetical protein
MFSYLKNDFIYDMLSIFPTLVYISSIDGAKYYKLWNFLILFKLRTVHSSIALIQGNFRF